MTAVRTAKLLTMLSALITSKAHAQAVLAIAGTCPGPIQVDMVGLTPGGTVAAIHGDAPGADAIPEGAPSCAGTLTGLSGPTLYALLADMDNDGELRVTPNAPNSQCGRFVQLVDLGSCQTSNVQQLLTGTCEVSGRMALVPGMRFLMGSPEEEVGHDPNEAPQHLVTLTHSFCLDRTEVTQAEFGAVSGVNPSYHAGCPDCPVESVTWHEAARYANAVSDSEGLGRCYDCSLTCDAYCQIYGLDPAWRCSSLGNPYTCEGYRLPMEAEWERAARAGIAGAAYPNGGSLFAGDESECGGNLVLTNGTVLDDIGWYCGNASGSQPVARLLPNAYGIYDLSGNVFEWCNHDFKLYNDDVVDPLGGIGDSMVVRGGSYFAEPSWLRVSFRSAWNYGSHLRNLGLRLARSNP